MNAQPIPNLDTALAFDDEHGNYVLRKVGWQENDRIHHTILHVALKEGKIWVEEDWTEDGIATYLLEHDVPKEHIVLAFHPPALRQYSDFAPATS